MHNFIGRPFKQREDLINIKEYYIKNDKWVPKDKKLLKSIKKDDEKIYYILKNKSFDKYEMLVNIYKYIEECP